MYVYVFNINQNSEYTEQDNIHICVAGLAVNLNCLYACEYVFGTSFYNSSLFMHTQILTDDSFKHE